MSFKTGPRDVPAASRSDLVERRQESGLLAGEAVASLDGGDGALHVARHQQLRQLQQTVAKHKELKAEEEEIQKVGKRENKGRFINDCCFGSGCVFFHSVFCFYVIVFTRQCPVLSNVVWFCLSVLLLL